MRAGAMISMLAVALLGGVAASALPPLPSSPPAPPPSTPVPPSSTPTAPTPTVPPAPTPTVPTPNAPAPTGERRTIAIIPFEATLPSYIFGTGPSTPDGDCGQMSRPGADVAKRCTQELVEAIVAVQRFRVIDRDTVDRVLAEQGFLRSQGVAPSELVRLGKLLGADRLIVGSVDLAGTQCRRVEVRASGYLRFEFGGGIEVSYRVLDVTTGEIAAVGRLTRTWDTRPNPELRGVLSSPEAALAFFAEQMAQAETMAVLDAIDPVKIAAVETGAIVLNQGRGRGLEPGMALRVFRKIEPIRDPDTGAVLTEQGPEVAVIEVIEVLDRVSRARIISGSASGIVVGAACRPIELPAHFGR
ncbi:MAG: hypothetical protein FJ253_07095 [Phycisphaerae bacterium]|nr:hypothetical protein [Phycisphaerae bacterium]